MSITITIDGRPFVCEQGEYLADVAQRNGIDIPVLCGKQEVLSGSGCCRVCIVEVIESGRSKVVASCIYPVQRACEVHTANERIVRERGVILALLKGLAPESAFIAEMAQTYGAPYIERLDPSEGEGSCILCGLCVVACQSLGAGAISSVSRGVNKKVSTPYDEASPDCIGCGSCAAVCPTRCISVQSENDRQTIWGQEFLLAYCAVCGAELGTRASVEYAGHRAQDKWADTAKEVATEADLENEVLQALCPLCKKKQMSEAFVYASAPGA